MHLDSYGLHVKVRLMFSSSESCSSDVIDKCHDSWLEALSYYVLTALACPLGFPSSTNCQSLMTTDLVLMIRSLDADPPKLLLFQGPLTSFKIWTRGDGIQKHTFNKFPRCILSVNIIGIKQFLKIA